MRIGREISPKSPIVAQRYPQAVVELKSPTECDADPTKKSDPKYRNYRDKNNDASRKWREKAKQKQAENMTRNKQLLIQHKNLINLIQKLSGDPTFQSANLVIGSQTNREINHLDQL